MNALHHSPCYATNTRILPEVGKIRHGSAILFNVEERIQVLDRQVCGHEIGLEIAPFVDFGRVQQLRFDQKLNLKNWQTNPGTSFRFLARPDVVGRVDVAYGRDGPNAFVGLDYPF